jgi:hypothetical protein
MVSMEIILPAQPTVHSLKHTQRNRKLDLSARVERGPVVAEPKHAGLGGKQLADGLVGQSPHHRHLLDGEMQFGRFRELGPVGHFLTAHVLKGSPLFSWFRVADTVRISQFGRFRLTRRRWLTAISATLSYARA